MRFVEDGPDLPSHLLEQQASGNTIFFCGAGVSMPAGLDSFWSLTDRIVTALDAQKARKLLDDGSDFDRIFNLLVKEFDRNEVDRQIYLALGTKRAKTLAHHRAILSLARGPGGSTQLVTTNFDTLFERAGCRASKIVPPNLPNLDVNQPLSGIVYLHGRLTDPLSGQQPNYIISSADFGRAYLAERWAARFVRQLRERYTLVFLGYSAEDPPMRYLLEGLNNRTGVVYDNPIYAFSAALESNTDESWFDRGVTPISYDPANSHAQLWQSIEAWSRVATDPEGWRASLVAQAQRGPRALRSFERGQVVELVSTKMGAAALADADPPVTSEWLCVFDPNARYARAQKLGWEDDAESVDPHEVYGLDSDPARPPEGSNRLFEQEALNPLAWRLGDGDQSSQETLQGSFYAYRTTLSPRLHHLARWFGKVFHEPAAVWWASGWKQLNPHLLWFAARGLRDRAGSKLAPQPLSFWTHYLENAESQTFDDQEYRWFEFESIIRSACWTSPSLRYFEKCTQPTVVAKRPLLRSPCPPAGDWDEIALREVAEFEVRVLDRHGSNLAIPAAALPSIIRILRNSFLRMVELLDEVDNSFWRPPNLHPSDRPGETYHGKKESLVLWFSKLFRDLIQQDCQAAKIEFNSWPGDEERVFSKLRIWAASLPGLLSDQECLELVTALSDDVFWSSDEQRGILILLKQRWGGWNTKARRKIERRIEMGPIRRSHQTKSEHRLWKSSVAASRLRWLELNGCQLSANAERSLNRLKVVDERWSDKWAEVADESLGPRGGMIAQVTDPQGLERFPVNDILDEATRLTRENFEELSHYRPFRGLSEEHPFKALSALRRALKVGDFREEFWIDLLTSWPKRTSLRLRILFGCTLSRLSDEQALKLRYYSTDWLKSNLALLHRLVPSLALAIFDGFLRPFMRAPTHATDSSVGETRVAGVLQEVSQVSIMKAINSPVGKLCEALWSLTPNKARHYGTMPEDFAMRFHELLRVPGHGAGHAVAILTQRLGWIVYCYKSWADEFIVPLFDLFNPLSEAAWHGFVYNRNPPNRETWASLRSPFLTIVQGAAPWPFEREARRALIDAMMWLATPDTVGGPLFDLSEIRGVLKNLDDEGRGHALWALGNVLESKSNWSEFVKPVIEQAWPRERRYRSEETTRGFLRIAENSGENFPDVVATIRPLLRPVPYADTFTYRLTRDGANEDSNARSHPREAIQLLNAITGDDRVTIPYGLAGSLDTLAEADPQVREMPEYRRLRSLSE